MGGVADGRRGLEVGDRGAGGDGEHGGVCAVGEVGGEPVEELDAGAVAGHVGVDEEDDAALGGGREEGEDGGLGDLCVVCVSGGGGRVVIRLVGVVDASIEVWRLLTGTGNQLSRRRNSVESPEDLEVLCDWDGEARRALGIRTHGEHSSADAEDRVGNHF